MNKCTLSLQFITIFLVICLLSAGQTQESTVTRHKRGFRMSAASRVAHGFGKRGFLGEQLGRQLDTSGFEDQSELRDLSEEDMDEPIMPIDQFTDLMRRHEPLAKALVKKFIDLDDNKLITTRELFRHVPKK